MAWAIEQQEVTDSGTQLVLLCLCNFADDRGANAFPSISTLCRATRMSESTVRRHLSKLVKTSIIRLGNQAIAAAHIARVDRRPTVYDIVTGRGVNMSPRQVNEVSKKVERGVKRRLTGCQALTPDPFGNPSLNRKSVLQTVSEQEGLARLRKIKAQLTGKPDPVCDELEEIVF